MFSKLFAFTSPAHLLTSPCIQRCLLMPASIEGCALVGLPSLPGLGKTCRQTIGSCCWVVLLAALMPVKQLLFAACSAQGPLRAPQQLLSYIIELALRPSSDRGFRSRSNGWLSLHFSPDRQQRDRQGMICAVLLRLPYIRMVKVSRKC